MKRTNYSRWCKALAAVCFFFGLCIWMTVGAAEVKAVPSDGFQVINGKSYYYKDGEPVKGWLTIGTKKYYFNSRTGVQLKGWAKNQKGQYRYFNRGDGAMMTGWVQNQQKEKRYFTKGSGIMLTGWAENSKNQKRYFNKGTGIMSTGWLKNKKGQLRYFTKGAGVMSTGWLESKEGNRRYFFSGSGVMATGWLQDSKGRRRYFDADSGIMRRDEIATIGSVTYVFDDDGVSRKLANGDYQYDESKGKVLVYDSKHKRNFYLAKEYLTHPGIADNRVSDRDLLAAICDAEANDQGVIGMQAVAMCILNRTLEKDFPSSVRWVIYDNTYGSYPQYSPVRDGALLKRLNGEVFHAKAEAYQAVDNALKMFNAYVKNGTKRKMPGFAKDDFDYLYFMTHQAFANQGLDPQKVGAVRYGDHTFFEDWIV